MDKTRRPVQPVSKAEIRSAYPSIGPLAESTCQDASRRLFIKQVGTGLGVAGVCAAFGLPPLAHGQSMEVDFSVLDNHPPADALLPADAAAQTAAEVEAMAAEQAAMEARGAQAAAAPASAPSMPLASPPSAGAGQGETTEDRALWIDPGYLVLVRWSRPVDNPDLVAAFEGAAPKITQYLADSVRSRDDLHQYEQLHGHEAALARLLQDRVGPARILVLHLNHDCNTVCSRFGGPPDIDIPLPGIAPYPEY